MSQIMVKLVSKDLQRVRGIRPDVEHVLTIDVVSMERPLWSRCQWLGVDGYLWAGDSVLCAKPISESAHFEQYHCSFFLMRLRMISDFLFLRRGAVGYFQSSLSSSGFIAFIF